MTSILRGLVLLLGSLAMAFGLACGGDSAGDGSDAEPAAQAPARTPDPLLADGEAALRESVQRLHGARTVDSEFEWSIRRDGFRAEGDGRYVVQEPDAMHLVVHYNGKGTVPTSFNEENDSDLLVLGEEVYLDSPAIHDGWVIFTPEELAEDWDVARRLIAARSPVNYATIVEGLSGPVENIGEESIDRRLYHHYRAPIDALVLTDALADAYGAQGQIMLTGRFRGPATLDVWLDPVTLLPRRLVGQGQVTFHGGATKLEVSLEFVELDGPVSIPRAPKDAITLDDLIAKQSRRTGSVR